MENNHAYFEKDPKKGLNWLRNFPQSSCPGYPAITFSRTLLLEGTAEQVVMCEYSVTCVNIDTGDRDICMSVHTHVCLYMYGYIHTLTGNIHIVYLYIYYNIYVTAEQLMKSRFLPADITCNKNLKRKTLLPKTRGI